MSTLESQKLSGYSDAHVWRLYTEDVTLKSLSNEDIELTTQPFMLFSEIEGIHELVMILLVFVIGIVINSIIFRCYFCVKSDIARYIRAFALFDMFSIAISLSARLVVLYAASQTYIKRVLLTTSLQCVNYSMLGPLFLALDRFLIVSFPHNFQLHERKMRRFKIAVLLVTVALSSVFIFDSSQRDANRLYLSLFS